SPAPVFIAPFRNPGEVAGSGRGGSEPEVDRLLPVLGVDDVLLHSGQDLLHRLQIEPRPRDLGRLGVLRQQLEEARRVPDGLGHALLLVALGREHYRARLPVVSISSTGMPSTVSVSTDSASEPMSAGGFSIWKRNAEGLRITYWSVMATLRMLVSPVRISTPVTRSSPSGRSKPTPVFI